MDLFNNIPEESFIPLKELCEKLSAVDPSLLGTLICSLSKRMKDFLPTSHSRKPIAHAHPTVRVTRTLAAYQVIREAEGPSYKLLDVGICFKDPMYQGILFMG